MKKAFDFLDLMLALGVGMLITSIISAVIYALGAPHIIMLLALALITTAVVAFVCYRLGMRRSKTESLVAYNKGITRGRAIGKAEARGEVQRYLEQNR